MHDAVGAGIVESRARLFQQRHQEFQLAVRHDGSGQYVGQAAPFHQLHRDIGEPILLASVEDCDDPGVGEPTRQPRLANQPIAHALDLARVCVRSEPDGLQRDFAINLGVVRSIYDAHRPAAQLGDNPVPSDLFHPRATYAATVSR